MKKLLISISIVALVALAPLALAHGPSTKASAKSKAGQCTDCKAQASNAKMDCANCKGNCGADCEMGKAKPKAAAKAKAKTAAVKDVCATCPGVQTKPCEKCAEKAKHASHTHANNLHDGCQECAKACPICNGTAK